MRAPDVVGNIRVDQAWGLFQISGALHEVNGSYNTLNALRAPAGATGLAGAAPTNLSEISGHPDTKWGGSVMAALQIKNIPTGAGDDIKMDVTWAKGDTKNVISTSAASPSFTMFGGAGNWRLPEHRLRGDHGCCLASGRAQWRRWQPPSDRSLRLPRCVQPQLGSVLVDELVRQLFGGSLRRYREGQHLRRLYCSPGYGLPAQTTAATRTSTSRSLALSPAGPRSRT